MWAGVRAILFLRVTQNHLRVSPLQLAALVLALLLPPLVEQVVPIGVRGEFNSYGIAGVFLVFSFGFVIAAIVATFSRQRDALSALLIIFLAAEIVIDLISIALPYGLRAKKWGTFYQQHYEQITLVSAYWLAMSVAVAWSRLLATSRWQLRGISFFTALLIIVVWQNITWDRTIWMPVTDNTQNAERLERYSAPVREEVLYLQPQLLTQALDRLQPATDSTPQLYFLGFAPYASQNVFMREINSVNALFETRFAKPEHVLTLINNAQTLHTVPLATKTALARALTRFGQVMDSDRDVLFLYLTSHGSREHHLSVEFGPLHLDDVTPTDLKQMLDDAQIKWRVIAISACYSGGFIDALKSDNTLVMTAAARDKTSFGCSDEESFTYFGKAYFDDALKQNDSFIDAFATAKALVTEREKAKGYDPSNPQIALGGAIEKKLREFEQQRNDAGINTRLNETSKVEKNDETTAQ